MIRTAALLCAFALTGAASPPPSPTAVPGSHEEAHAHWAVATSDAQTQSLIDRGTAMLFAFDTGEARVAFEQASRREPDLALPYWGMAEADTIDINDPTTPEGERRGAVAAAAAHAHLAHATEVERMLADAVAKRYAPGSKEQRFRRYADVLSAYTKVHRDDPNVLTVAAFALWNAADGLLDGNEPNAKAREMLGDLERALLLEPTNLGAHHLRIHLLEEIHRAREAVPDADALSSYGYPPGESHLPHMAGHVWARIGDYERLVSDNERALANDRAWFALGDGPGQRTMRVYHDHDLDFVSYGLTTLGRDDDARSAVAAEDARAQLQAAVRLHDDERALTLGAGQNGYLAYLRAFAAARRGDAARARTERARAGLDAVQSDLLGAALGLGAQDLPRAVAAYARAYGATKNDAPGDPKARWATPIGEGYGAALLGVHRDAQAEAVFAAELKRFPNDPRLEWGLAQAQKAQGKDDAAARAAYRAHWRGPRDLTLDRLG